MKVWVIVLKILAALAVVAGIAYVVITYGDKIVSWTKQMVGKIKNHCHCECEFDFQREEPDTVHADENDFQG